MSSYPSSQNPSKKRKYSQISFGGSLPSTQQTGSMSGGPIKKTYKKNYSRRKFVTASQVKQIIQQQSEKKRVDTAASSTVDFNGTVINLCDPAVGDSNNQKTGIRITPTSTQARIAVTAADATNLMRIVIFRWLLDDTVTVPTAAMIFENTGAVQAPLSPFASGNRERFNVLYDKLVSVSTNGPAVVSWEDIITHSKNKDTVFSSSGVTTGTGKLYCVFISDSGAATHPSITYYFRTNYLDLG